MNRHEEATDLLIMCSIYEAQRHTVHSCSPCDKETRNNMYSYKISFRYPRPEPPWPKRPVHSPNIADESVAMRRQLLGKRDSRKRLFDRALIEDKSLRHSKGQTVTDTEMTRHLTRQHKLLVAEPVELLP